MAISLLLAKIGWFYLLVPNEPCSWAYPWIQPDPYSDSDFYFDSDPDPTSQSPQLIDDILRSTANGKVGGSLGGWVGDLMVGGRNHRRVFCLLWQRAHHPHPDVSCVLVCFSLGGLAVLALAATDLLAGALNFYFLNLWIACAPRSKSICGRKCSKWWDRHVSRMVYTREKDGSKSKKFVTLLYSISKCQKSVYRQCAIGIYWQIMRKLIIRIQSYKDKTKKL